MAIEHDPFDALLSLEDEFYQEGYDLGVHDGQQAGLVEGRLFGLEKGFEKYSTMGRLHGRAMIWAGRLPGPGTEESVVKEQVEEAGTRAALEESSLKDQNAHVLHARDGHVPQMPASTRLEAHVRTLYALAEPGSLSTENNEDSVSEFDDRLKRADGKAKIIEKLTGESSFKETTDELLLHKQATQADGTRNKKGDGSIEDMSSLHARH